MAVAGVPDQRRPVKAALAWGQADPQAPCILATRESARERPAFLAGLFDFAANQGAALGLFRLHDGLRDGRSCIPAVRPKRASWKTGSRARQSAAGRFLAG
jgi:hypothetical protein